MLREKLELSLARGRELASLQREVGLQLISLRHECVYLLDKFGHRKVDLDARVFLWIFAPLILPITVPYSIVKRVPYHHLSYGRELVKVISEFSNSSGKLDIKIASDSDNPKTSDITINTEGFDQSLVLNAQGKGRIISKDAESGRPVFLDEVMAFRQVISAVRSELEGGSKPSARSEDSEG